LTGLKPFVDVAAAEAWIRVHVQPVGAIALDHERPWANVYRVPVEGGVVWFKSCAEVQAFEPRLTAQLFTRWPDRVTEVLAHDGPRRWLLLADAGTPVRDNGNPPDRWLVALPLYAELQRGEAAYATDHLTHGVPDRRLATLPDRYRNDLLRRDLPLSTDEMDRLRDFAPRFTDLCSALAGYALPDTVQHDDLHMANLFVKGRRMRLIDWGDASISHPFASLVVTYRFLEEFNKLSPTDPWFTRLRDAYLEPWGRGLTDAFALAMRVGAFAHAAAWVRQRDAFGRLWNFDPGFATVLRRALAYASESE